MDLERDALMRSAAFERVRALCEVHDHLTAQQLSPGFHSQGQRYPLVNPRRGIFKPAQMRFLLTVGTVFPKSGNRVWYDDQREVHRQIFDGDEMVDYAFMGDDPDTADNRWLREAYENKIPIIYFLGDCPRPVPGHPARLHRRLGRTPQEGADRLRFVGTKCVGTAGDRSRAPLRVAVGETATAPGLLPGGGHWGLPRPLRAFRTT